MYVAYTTYTARTLGGTRVQPSDEVTAVTEEPTPGQRLQVLRARRGYSQEELARVASVNPNTIKSIEVGRRNLTLRIATRLAPVLGVTDLSELFGSPVRFPLDASQVASHPAIPEVRKALTSWRPELGGRAESGEYLRGAVDTAWQTWHTSPNQRTEAARILPGLLDATRRSARLADGPDRPLVLAMEAQAYHLAQAFLAWHGERELVFLTVDRGMLAANESRDPLAIGSSVWYAAAVLRAVGRAEEALDGLAEARALIERAEPTDGSRAVERAAVLADLWLRSALTKARAGDRSAWQDLDAAAEIVHRDLPEDYTHPWTRVGRVLLDVKRVMLAVEFGDPDEARRVAESIDPQSIPSTERRARHLIEVARGLNMEGSPEAVLLLLQQAAAISPETVAFTPAGRDLTMRLVKVVGKTQRADVLALAARIGLEV